VTTFLPQKNSTKRALPNPRAVSPCGEEPQFAIAGATAPAFPACIRATSSDQASGEQPVSPVHTHQFVGSSLRPASFLMKLGAVLIKVCYTHYSPSLTIWFVQTRSALRISRAFFYPFLHHQRSLNPVNDRLG
jgi:hypothetical protein